MYFTIQLTKYCNYWLPCTPKWCPSIFLIINLCLDLAKVLCMLALHCCLTYWLCGNLAPLESECRVQLPPCFWRWWQMQVNVLVDEERICLRGNGWTINPKGILSQLLFRVFPMVSDMQYQSSDLASKFRALPSVVFRRDGDLCRLD